MADRTPRIRRETVDLSAFPDLVAITLGMRARTPRGLLTLLRFGPRIEAAVAANPDGLLDHQTFLVSLLPPHVGFRQYWRDLESLERFTRASPHGDWWRHYLSDTAGTGFWHEACCRSGGFEAVYVNVDAPVGMMRFAPVVPARGPAFSARRRLGRGEPSAAAPVAEAELETGAGPSA